MLDSASASHVRIVLSCESSVQPNHQAVELMLFVPLQAKIKACHKCASQHLSHLCKSSKPECGPDNYKGNQHCQKLSFCFR